MLVEMEIFFGQPRFSLKKICGNKKIVYLCSEKILFSDVERSAPLKFSTISMAFV
jgi:hypothetical protein